jgi:hypothetical protein
MVDVRLNQDEPYINCEMRFRLQSARTATALTRQLAGCVHLCLRDTASP